MTIRRIRNEVYSLQIRRVVKENPKIPKAVHVYFRHARGRLEVAGIEREE